MATTPAEPTAPTGRTTNRKPFFKRIWFWLLAIVVLIIVIAVSQSGGSDDDAGTVSGDPSQDAPASDAPTFQGQQEGDTVAQAGQSITVDDVVTTTTPLTEGQALGTTPVVCSTVTIVNNSDESVSFNGGFDWNLQDPAGASRSTTLGGSDTLLSAGDLAPGGTVSGDVCFDLQQAAPGQYAVIYAPAFSFSDDRAVWINNR